MTTKLPIFRLVKSFHCLSLLLPTKRQSICVERISSYFFPFVTPGFIRFIVRPPKQIEYLKAGITEQYRRKDMRLGVKFVDENIKTFSDLERVKKKRKIQETLNLFAKVEMLEEPIETDGQPDQKGPNGDWAPVEAEGTLSPSSVSRHTLESMEKSDQNGQDLDAWEKAKLEEYINHLKQENEQLRWDTQTQSEATQRLILESNKEIAGINKGMGIKIANVQGLILRDRRGLNPKGVLDYICDAYGPPEKRNKRQHTLNFLYKKNEPFRDDVVDVLSRIGGVSIRKWEEVAGHIYYRVNELTGTHQPFFGKYNNDYDDGHDDGNYVDDSSDVGDEDEKEDNDTVAVIKAEEHDLMSKKRSKLGLTEAQVAVLAGYMQHYKIKGKIILLNGSIVRIPL